MSTGRGAARGPFGRVALLDIDRPVAEHAHPHCHVLIKVAGADSFFRVRGRTWPMFDDTVVVVNCWEPHAYPYPNSAAHSLILALYIETDWLARIDRSFAASATPEFFRQPCYPLPSSLRRVAGDVSDALLAGEQCSNAFEYLLGTMMVLVVEYFSQWRVMRGSPLSPLCVRDFRIRRAIGYLQENVGSSFAMADVAKEAGLSRAHFFERFRQETGLTPNILYNALRMETAYSELHRTAPLIREISTRLGFAGAGHFSRFFRGNFGVAPSEYRRMVSLH